MVGAFDGANVFFTGALVGAFEGVSDGVDVILTGDLVGAFVGLVEGWPVFLRIVEVRGSFPFIILSLRSKYYLN